MKPSEKIKAIADPKQKTTATAHERLDALEQYLDDSLPLRTQLASGIAGSILAGGKMPINDAVRISLEVADKLLQ